MTPTRTGDRIDWKAERDRIDLAAVATNLLGPAPGRSGYRSLWHCPWHDDRNPSLVIDPVKKRWRCYPCGIGGDAVDLVMRHESLTFPEAIAHLTGRPSPAGTTRPRPSPQARPASTPPEPRGMPLEAALALVAESEARLWSDEGADALGYLAGRRRLSLETIRAARLGWTPRAEGVAWSPPGVVVPWFDGPRLALAKLRPPDEWRMTFPEDRRPPKYLEAFRDRPTVYPSPGVVRPGRPLVVVEGEFDALLLGQELSDRAAVVTLGSASSKLTPETRSMMRPASPWFLATDGDPAGDLAATGWPGRAVRVKPPATFKDWTEARQAGVNLRRWWSDRLDAIEKPELFSWDQLSSWRWGDAVGDPEPGIDIDRPDPARRLAALQRLASDATHGDAYEGPDQPGDLEGSQ